MGWFRAALAAVGAMVLVGGILEAVHGQEGAVALPGAGLLAFALCMPVKKSESN